MTMTPADVGTIRYHELVAALRGDLARSAACRPGATAFAHRDGGWAGIIAGVDPDPANAGLISQWARDYWQELHPTSAGGAYAAATVSSRA